MRTWPLSQAELDAKLRTARGAKRRKILRELQHRYDETVPRLIQTRPNSYALVQRYDFELQHA